MRPKRKPSSRRSFPSASSSSIARNVARAGFPEINETILAVETERAIAQIRGGTPLPLDADASNADGYFLADLSERKAATLRLERLTVKADERCWAARHALAQLIPPLSPRAWAALVVALCVITLIGVYALKTLLSSSFDELLFRAYYEGLAVADAAIVSARQAEMLVMLVASCLLGGKALAVVGSSGKLSIASKVLLAAVALVFSAALAAVRLSDGGGFAAVAVPLVELALLGSYTLLLLAIGDVLQSHAERTVAYRAAQGVVAVEDAHRADLDQARAAALQDFEIRRRTLAQREDDCRRLPLNEAVARATVEAEYLVATAELMTTTAEAAYGDAPAVLPPSEEQPGGVP